MMQRHTPRLGQESQQSMIGMLSFVVVPPSGAGLFSRSPIIIQGGDTMRIPYVLCFLIAVFSVPAAAADADQNLKQEIEKIGSAYAENFNKQNGAGIAELYASGGMIVNATGPHTDIAQAYEGLFKAGFNHSDITVQQVLPLGPDTLLAIGEYHNTGKNQSGAPLDVAGVWTATDVREGGSWEDQDAVGDPQAAAAPKVNSF
jgi:ketosteroid isomerase-like protein